MDMKGDTVIHVLQNVRTKCSQLSCSNDIFIKLKLLHLVFNEIPQLLKNAWMIWTLLEDFDSASLFRFSKFPWMVLQQPLSLCCFVANFRKTSLNQQTIQFFHRKLFTIRMDKVICHKHLWHRRSASLYIRSR